MPAAIATVEIELDPRRLEQRQKQIDYGLATIGYANYVAWISRFGTANIKPIVTPNIYWKCSKRTWDSLVREWRRELHLWDAVFGDKTPPPNTNSMNMLAGASVNYGKNTGRPASPEVSYDGSSFGTATAIAPKLQCLSPTPNCAYLDYQTKYYSAESPAPVVGYESYSPPLCHMPQPCPNTPFALFALEEEEHDFRDAIVQFEMSELLRIMHSHYIDAINVASTLQTEVEREKHYIEAYLPSFPDSPFPSSTNPSVANSSSQHPPRSYYGESTGTPLSYPPRVPPPAHADSGFRQRYWDDAPLVSQTHLPPPSRLSSSSSPSYCSPSYSHGHSTSGRDSGSASTFTEELDTPKATSAASTHIPPSGSGCSSCCCSAGVLETPTSFCKAALARDQTNKGWSPGAAILLPRHQELERREQTFASFTTPRRALLPLNRGNDAVRWGDPTSFSPATVNSVTVP